ncbi:hypothetical protein C9I44_05745 [Lactococcus garvieae]|uniref:AbiH family protein n=1 Tax=Lactococcus TaxID=1357 RepID=UPI000EC26AA7|nr:AbiH family protein [Lactococcus garvieae]UHU65960.1 hypothetical protein C9I44_05745 [Lactococcus garvieae]HCS86147.1 hypothetical protein [Lactococcus garvieae]
MYNKYLPIDQLIILGNGFDLSCGLKSSYNEFFEYIYSDSIKTQKNYWYYIFKKLSKESQNLSTWTDIEKQILTELKNVEWIYREEIKSFHSLRMETAGRDIDEIKSIEITYLGFEDLIERRYSGFPRPRKEEIQEVLREELRVLENDFSDYLENQIKEQVEKINQILSTGSGSIKELYLIKTLIITCYIVFSQRRNSEEYYIEWLMKVITQFTSISSYDDLLSKCSSEIIKMKYEASIQENHILSFNYTSPNSIFNLTNIHGALDTDDTIFGIDYDKLNVNFENPPIEFSKSYRILENGNTKSLNVSSKIDVLKFYGHGLGEADYSYFQSIFDSVDLYHSNTIVIFYWSPYEGCEKHIIHRNQVKCITKLIEDYGTTFNNKDHGRNLLTKLQLENRLHIQEIPIEKIFSM